MEKELSANFANSHGDGGNSVHLQRWRCLIENLLIGLTIGKDRRGRK